MQGVPDEIRGIIDDLKILQVIVDDLRHGEEIFGHRPAVAISLQGCQRKINALHLIVDEIVPNLSSKRFIRKWLALKATLGKGRLQKFKATLEESKLSFPRAVADNCLQFQLYQKGDVVGLRQLLSCRGASVNDVDSDGKTLLHTASAYHDYEMVEMLLSAGSDVGAVMHPQSDVLLNMRTPFTMACCPSPPQVDFDNVQYRSSIERINVLRLLSASGQAVDDMEIEDFADQLENLVEQDILNENEGSCHGEYSSLRFICNFPTEVKQAIALRANKPNEMEWLWARCAFLETDEVVKMLLKVEGRLLHELTFDAIMDQHDSSPAKTTLGLKMFVEAGVDLHRTTYGRAFANTTQTMRALKSPYKFWRWRELLLDCVVNLEEFVAVEMATSCFGKMGWTKASLLELLRYMPEPIAPVYFPGCKECGRYRDELWWHEYVESIVAWGMDPRAKDSAMFAEETEHTIDGTPLTLEMKFYRKKIIFPKRLRRAQESITRCGICRECEHKLVLWYADDQDADIEEDAETEEITDSDDNYDEDSPFLFSI